MDTFKKKSKRGSNLVTRIGRRFLAQDAGMQPALSFSAATFLSAPGGSKESLQEAVFKYGKVADLGRIVPECNRPQAFLGDLFELGENPREEKTKN